MRMSEAEVVGTVLMALASIIGAFMLVASPLLKLNRTMTELETTLRCMRDRNVERDAVLKDHGARIDKVEDTVAEHEYRLDRIEEDGQKGQVRRAGRASAGRGQGVGYGWGYERGDSVGIKDFYVDFRPLYAEFRRF